MEDAKTELSQMKGAFVGSLKRNNKQIRDDRALAIAEGAELLFKREVEDLETELKTVKRDRDNMLDMGGNNTTNIIALSDFDAKEFVAEDMKLGLRIREIEIKLEVARDRYKVLFEGEVE